MALNFPNTSIDSNGSRLRVNGYFRSANATVPAFLTQNDQDTNITTGNGRPATWNQTIFNDGGGFDTSGRQLFTAPIAGIYFFYVWMMDSNSGSNTNDYYSIRKNNSASATNTLLVYSSGRSSHHHQWPGGTFFNMAAGDNVRVYIDRTDVGMYGNDHHYTMFQGCYLGRS